MRFDGYRRSESGPATPIVGSLSLRPRAVGQLATVLMFGLLLGSSAFGQTRKYRSITWEKFKASGPELKQIGGLLRRRGETGWAAAVRFGLRPYDNRGRIQKGRHFDRPAVVQR